MTTIQTGLFTVSYPTGDGWVCEEDDISDESDYSSVDLRIPAEDSYYEVYLRIYADIDSPHSFRESLYNYGFDEYALVEQNAYDYVTLGGQQLLQWDNSYGDYRYYFGRNESAGANLSVLVQGNLEDARVARVLDTLHYQIEEVGNEDDPWYWEGEPFSCESFSTMVGTHTLTSEFLPMEEPLITHELFDHDIEIVGDKAYILSDGVLRSFSFDGASLTSPQELPTDEGFDYIDAASDGTLILSGFASPCTGYKDGTKVFSYTGTDYFTAAPDGTWGISYFTSVDHLAKVCFSDGAMTSEPFPVSGLSSATGVWIDSDSIFITGQDAETGAQVVQVYDHDGSLEKTLLGEDGRLGCITFIARTDNGYLALDGNMRTVVLWNADGAYIGEADDGDLFGTSYPWFCAADMQPDGSLILILTERRPDESATELVAFRLTGF